MASEAKGRGCMGYVMMAGLLVLALVLVGAWFGKDRPARSGGAVPTVAAAAKPKIAATLGDFKEEEGLGLVGVAFMFRVENQGTNDVTIYPFAYGKNSQGEGSAWPTQPFDSRGVPLNQGNLKPSSYTDNWDNTIKTGIPHKFTVAPGKLKSHEGIVTYKKARASEVRLWVFTEDGTLILDREYDLK